MVGKERIGPAHQSAAEAEWRFTDGDRFVIRSEFEVAVPGKTDRIPSGPAGAAIALSSPASPDKSCRRPPKLISRYRLHKFNRAG